MPRTVKKWRRLYDSLAILPIRGLNCESTENRRKYSQLVRCQPSLEARAGQVRIPKRRLARRTCPCTSADAALPGSYLRRPCCSSKPTHEPGNFARSAAMLAAQGAYPGLRQLRRSEWRDDSRPERGG